MSEDIYAKPDLTKKVRFQTGEKKDGNAYFCDNADNVVIYDNYRAEESPPPLKLQDNTTKDQQQTTPVNESSRKRNLLRAAVCLGLLCLLLLLTAVIVLLVLFSQDKSNCIMERKQLWVDKANLTSERDELQSRYSDMKSLNANLKQKTSQLEKEKGRLQAVNNNLTKERDELQNRIEKTYCPARWIKFGNSCYLIPSSKKTWSDSKRECEKRDALLVIISSQEEQNFINLFNLEIWIGLTDEKVEGVWKWVDGTNVTTTYWKTGQPDNWENREHCVQIKEKRWNDLKCRDILNFICEKTLQ